MSGAPRREAVGLRGVPAVDVGDTDHYYDIAEHRVREIAEAMPG